MADISKSEETGKPIDEQCIRVGAECSRPKCKDCVHYDVCYELTYHEPNGEIVGREVCNNFKDKSRFVELPCEIGREVYWINNGKLYKSKFSLADMCGAYGKTVFLTREEVEKALKGRKK